MSCFKKHMSCEKTYNYIQYTHLSKALAVLFLDPWSMFWPAPCSGTWEAISKNLKNSGKKPQEYELLVFWWLDISGAMYVIPIQLCISYCINPRNGGFFYAFSARTRHWIDRTAWTGGRHEKSRDQLGHFNKNLQVQIDCLVVAYHTVCRYNILQYITVPKLHVWIE